MTKSDLYDKVEQGLSTRELAEVFSCSQSNIQYWLKKYKLKTNISREKYCVSCNGKLHGNQRKYCSPNCKAKGHYHNGNGYDRQSEKAKSRKKEIIKSMGGKCVRCGYSRNMAALEFHHIDSATKQFNIDSRVLGNHSMKLIYEELKKCELLCSNCHKEHHYPDWTLPG